MNFNLASVIIILALSFGLVFGLIVPKYNSVLETGEKLKQAETELADYRELTAKSEEYLNKLGELSQDIDKINFALPLKKDESSVLASVEKLAVDSGLILKNIDVKIGAEKQAQRLILGELQEKKYKTLIINLELSGKYDSIKPFLGALEKNMPIMNVVSFDINHEKEDLLSYKLIIETYYLPE